MFKENTSFEQFDSSGGEEENGQKETGELKVQISSQDNMTNENKSCQLVYGEGKGDQILNQLMDQIKEHGKDDAFYADNVNTGEIIESNVHRVHNNINEYEQIASIPMKNEGSPTKTNHLHSSICQKPLQKYTSQIESSKKHSVEEEPCLKKNLTIKEDPEYSFIPMEPNQLENVVSTNPFIEDLNVESNEFLKESLSCKPLSLHSSKTNGKETKLLIEEISSNGDDTQTELTRGIFHFKDTRLDKMEQVGTIDDDYFNKPAQRSSEKKGFTTNSNYFIQDRNMTENEDREANFLKSENTDIISPKQLIEEIFNEECSIISQDQGQCNEIEDIVDSLEINTGIKEEKLIGKICSEVTSQSGQVEEKYFSNQCFNKKKTFEKSILDNEPLKLKKVEAKEDISIKKTENSFDLLGSCHDQSAIHEFSIASKDDLGYIGTILNQNSSIKYELEFANTSSIKLEQTKKETLSNLSFKLLGENVIPNKTSAPLKECKIKSSCVTLADWQRLVYGESNENEAHFILNEEQTELGSDEQKEATDSGSYISDTDSYLDKIKTRLGANRHLEGIFKTNLIKIGKHREMFASLPNIEAEKTTCSNFRESKINSSCSLPSICQTMLLKDKFTINYPLFLDSCDVKTKRGLEHEDICELKPEIDNEVREHFSSQIAQDVDLNKETTKDVQNDTGLSPTDKDLNCDKLNLVENQEITNGLFDETNTTKIIDSNDDLTEELKDDHISLPIDENEENTKDPLVLRYINRSLELQMASSQTKPITNDIL